MPFEEIDKEKIYEIINDISSKLNCNFDLTIFNNKIFLKFSKYIMIFKNENEILNKIDKEKLISCGIIFAILTKRDGVLPFISISDILINSCKNKLILPEKLAEKLTYGKKIILKEKLNNGYYIVLTKKGDFIGIVKVRREKEIIPILDIGWYLRRGG
ncbi:MAG: hypothetical protein QXV69_03375 [Sulfolobaceae archaeon]